MTIQMRAKALLPLLGIVATPLFLAVMGLTHPHDLTQKPPAIGTRSIMFSSLFFRS